MSRRSPLHRLPHVLVAAFVLALGLAAFADETPTSLDVGESTAAFEVDAITGPEAGETLCYVCQNRGAPTAIVFTRALDEGTVTLLTDLNDYVLEHEEQGAKAFVVFLGDREEYEDAVLTVVEENEFSIPFCFLAEGTDEDVAEAYKLDEAASATIYIARDNQVVTSVTATSDELAGSDVCRTAVGNAFATVVEIEG